MTDAPHYMTGFGGHFETEAVEGALPRARNSPQRPAYGLYAEQLSGTAFTMARHENRRSWLYRMRPTADHRPFIRYKGATLFAPGTVKEPLPPNRLRWDPPEDLPDEADFVDGMVTMLANRDPADLEGVAVHLYRASKSMERRVFVDADGEMLIIPQQGALRVLTELGMLELEPGWVGVVPRGVKFRVEVDGEARGYVAENHGAPFRLPELGPIGSNALANARDFEIPVALQDGLRLASGAHHTEFEVSAAQVHMRLRIDETRVLAEGDLADDFRLAVAGWNREIQRGRSGVEEITRLRRFLRQHEPELGDVGAWLA